MHLHRISKAGGPVTVDIHYMIKSVWLEPSLNNIQLSLTAGSLVRPYTCVCVFDAAGV